MPALLKSVSLRGLKSNVDALLGTLQASFHSNFRGQYKKYTDFVINYAQLQPLNHTGIHSSSQPLKFDPQAKGDKWCSLTAVVRLPAIQRNNTANVQTGKINGAYYVQNAGFALFPQHCVTAGSVDGNVITDDDLYHNYRSEDVYADSGLDPRVHMHPTLSQLKLASSANLTLHVPMYSSYFMFRQMYQSYAMNAVTRQSTELKVWMRSLNDITVNEGNAADLALLPFKRGTTTPIASSDVFVDFWSHFMIMSPEERAMQLSAVNSDGGWLMPFSYMTTITRDSPTTEVAGKDIQWQIAPNHPTSGFYLWIQPYSYVNKTQISPQGVGLVNYYDYSSSNRGESLTNIDWQFNGSSYLQSTDPIGVYRSNWQLHHAKLKKPYSTIYFVPIATQIDADIKDHTLNGSNVDKMYLVFRKNDGTSSAGLASKVTVKFVIQNVYTYKLGFGGIQWV